ncbi:MAG: hypothetical protein Q9166_001941 [cf. Caloplaca sp. 2 TL-2023]
METSAELLYLAEKIDKDNVFWFDDEIERSQCLQWMFFWHGGGAPNQGQLNFFDIFAKEHIPYAISRFRNETLRNFDVLESHLSSRYFPPSSSSKSTPRQYLVGTHPGKISIADIAIWPWVKGWKFAGFSRVEMEAFPCLMRWVERVGRREAVKRGIGEGWETNRDVEGQASAGE